ncbi:hypothetical protein Ancab_006113, partial [Ancistrocladus abbreviatus]
MNEIGDNHEQKAKVLLGKGALIGIASNTDVVRLEGGDIQGKDRSTTYRGQHIQVPKERLYLKRESVMEVETQEREYEWLK